MNAAAARKPVVLVVDDDAANQMLLAEVCRSEGYDVVAAADGEAALAIVSTQEVDLVLLDVAMPKLDGYRTCRRIRAEREVPVIMVSATSEPGAESRALECGAAAFMTKPFRVFELSRRMRAALRQSLMPSEPPTQAVQVRRRALAMGLGRTGGALPLRAALRAALEGGAPVSLLLARLDNEREILGRCGRTARDAVIGLMAEALEAYVPGAAIYCTDSNELVALTGQQDVKLASDAVALARVEMATLGVGEVVLRSAAAKVEASSGLDVDGVLRMLRAALRGEGGGGAGRDGSGEV